MSVAVAPATSERGWGKLLIALAAFLFLPHVPPFTALLPVEETLLLLLPALAACCLVGWWAGGRLLLAVVCIALCVRVLALDAGPGSFHNLVRGWSLLVAGAFGMVCLLGVQRPFFPRALTALAMSLAIVVLMSLKGPLTPERTAQAMQMEFARRNAAAMTTFRTVAAEHPEIMQRMPASGPMLTEFQQRLSETTETGMDLFPSLLFLESLVAMALAWTTFHRLSRTRLGAPLGPLKDFRFNDQLVWGLIAGLAIVFLPALGFIEGAGRNLLVFFGALYAIRGFGVLSWFLAPGVLAATLMVGFAMLWWPVLSVVAISGFVLLTLAAFGLGLGDTWADWRRRARPTT
jgi:hypothetical protein